MPIEIKELLIRAFVTDEKHSNDHKNDKAKEKKMNSAQDSLAMISNMLKQEKER